MKKHVKAPATASKGLLVLSAAVLAALPYLAQAQETKPADGAAKPADAKAADNGAKTGTAAQPADAGTLVLSSRSTRSTVSMRGSEIQKLLPGTNPIKAMQTLPGVSFQTADPWGNNEQNATLFIHGFSTQQLGYTLDGVPLGDQAYGNYNGLSPQRAVISENVGLVVLSTGAGDLATPSTSNLGGTIDTYSSAPQGRQRFLAEQTLGSYSASRTFLRYDTGEFGDGNSAYLSVMRLKARAWDFNGKQGGYHFNGKFVRDTDAGILTAYVSYSDKDEPNEDSIVKKSTVPNDRVPYTRPYMYPDFAYALTYLSPTNSATPAADGDNYRNYFSAAQRTDWLGYVKYEANLGRETKWTNQIYYHKDDGAGLVAGPIGVAGLPALFAAYFPNQNLKTVFGNSGYAERASEYEIYRRGLISNFRTEIGDHKIGFGLWWENIDSGVRRRWYAFDVKNPITPYDRPSNPLITQYYSKIGNDTVQLHLQDEWRVRPDVTVQGGFKSSLQFAEGSFPVQQLRSTLPAGSTGLPEGAITTKRWFLPQLGARWQINDRDQLFVNAQKNLRQFITYGAGGASPWSLTSQQLFDLFKQNAKPETSVTYELGLRGSRDLDLGPLTSIEGQANVYHVDFANRLLASTTNAVNLSILGGNTVLGNVGSVKTNGVDIATTLNFGPKFSFYNAISYNRSEYADDYMNGTTLVRTAGKLIPGAPVWMDKFVATAKFAGGIEAQLTGDWTGKRYGTFINDLSEGGYFIMGMSVAGKLPVPANGWIKDARLRLTVSNLNQEKGTLGLVTGQASGTYNIYTIPPRMFFLTLSASM